MDRFKVTFSKSKDNVWSESYYGCVNDPHKKESWCEEATELGNEVVEGLEWFLLQSVDCNIHGGERLFAH